MAGGSVGSAPTAALTVPAPMACTDASSVAGSVASAAAPAIEKVDQSNAVGWELKLLVYPLTPTEAARTVGTTANAPSRAAAATSNLSVILFIAMIFGAIVNGA